MDTNKLTTDTIVDAGAMIGGGLVGAGVSRVVGNALTKPNKDGKQMLNTKLASGILAAAGITCTALIKPTDTMSKAVQGACAGFGITQLNVLVKEIVQPKEDGMVKTALGAVEPEYIPIYTPSTTPQYEPYPEQLPETLSQGETYTYDQNPAFLSSAQSGFAQA